MGSQELSTIDIGKLVDYALQLDVGAVVRRLWYLLETFEVDAAQEIARLQSRLTASIYVRLGSQMSLLSPFDEVYRSVVRALRVAGLVEK